MLRHEGIRPRYELVLVNWKKKIWHEVFPDGRIRVWNTRMLRSGCGEIDRDERVEIVAGTELRWCKYCDEFFATEQWREA